MDVLDFDINGSDFSDFYFSLGDHLWMGLWRAFFVMVSILVGLILLILAMLMWMSPTPDRGRVLQVFKVEFLKEFEALLKSLRGK